MEHDYRDCFMAQSMMIGTSIAGLGASGWSSKLLLNLIRMRERVCALGRGYVCSIVASLPCYTAFVIAIIVLMRFLRRALFSRSQEIVTDVFDIFFQRFPSYDTTVLSVSACVQRDDVGNSDPRLQVREC